MAQTGRPKLNVPLVVGLVATALFVFLQAFARPAVLDNLEARSLDARFRLRGPRARRSDEVVIIGIDDATRQRYPEVFQRRRGWAKLLTAIAAYQPELVGIDAFYARPEIVLPPELTTRIQSFLTPAPALAPAPEPDPARDLLAAVLEETRGDAHLADAVAAAGNIYLGFVAVLDGPPAPLSTREAAALPAARYDEALSSPTLPAGARAPSAGALIATYDAIASRAAGAGAVNNLLDPDHTTRRTFLVVEHAGRHYAPLGLALLRRHLQLHRAPGQPPPDLAYIAGRGVTLAGRRLPSDARGRAIFDFLGPAGAFPTYSAADVIDHQIPAEKLRGKVVLVGFTDAARDKVATPFSPVVDGVELHATLFHNALHGELFTRSAPRTTLLTILGFGLFLSALQLRPIRRRAWVPAAAASLGLVAYLLGATLAFRARVWIDVAAPAAAYIVTALVTLAAALATEGREKQKLRGAFEHYVGDRLIDQILADPSKLRLGGERRVLTVLFSDIRGFSAFSERLDPEALARFLNEYLTPMTQIVLDQDGLLDKYIGDAVMAVYGAPLMQRDHAARACRSALAMQAALTDLNRGWQARGLPAIAIGIGLNTGTVSVGNMGSATRFDYTVMGDAVNLGSRLEALTKDYDVRILAGEATFAEAEAEFLFREVDLVRVKGKDRPARVYELLGAKGAETTVDLARFAHGLERYRAGDFAAAISDFEAILAKNADDGPARTLLARARTLAAAPPAEWSGVYDQLSK